VKPDDLSLLRVPGRPAFAAAGQILVAVSSPDLDANLYRGTLVRIHGGASPCDQDSDQDSDKPTALTVGPRDSEPVTSPDGRLVVFLRAAESGPPQLYAMPVGGGEPAPADGPSAGGRAGGVRP
jgi:dipeptidyl aminopeptidase/acylaminoacyl peptidase